MAGLRIHGVELAAGIGGLEHRDVVGTSSNGMRKAGDGRVAGTRRVHSRNRGRLGAERATLMEAHRTGSTHRNDNPGDTGKAAIGGKRLAQGIDIIGRKGRTQQAVNLGQVGFYELRLIVGLQRGLQRCARGVEQHLGARLLGDLDELGIVAGIDATRQRARKRHDVSLRCKLGELGRKGLKFGRRNLRAALQQLGLITLVQNIQANARLTGDGHKVVLDAVGIHKLGHIGTHVAAEQAGREHVVAQLQQHTAHVEALAASGLFGRHAVNVVDNQLVELIARIDRRVHGNGQNHVELLFPGHDTRGPKHTIAR